VTREGTVVRWPDGSGLVWADPRRLKQERREMMDLLRSNLEDPDNAEAIGNLLLEYGVVLKAYTEPDPRAFDGEQFMMTAETLKSINDLLE
jgi:hypothetical protein